MSRNRLAEETSPYLLQHKDNPVHWRPWNAEALAEAKATNKPILLSVGYAACHWCHVMAHESFEDDEVAAVMNALFVCIKVDREERPDIDQIYMNALHALGEQGGWPLTMFLTPAGEPFWGGTYFPKQSRWGRPGFIDVMKQISAIAAREPEKVASNARTLMEALKRQTLTAPGAALTPALLDEACERLLGLMDPLNGGTRGAPKFPQAGLLDLLRRAGLRTGDERFREAFLTALTQICSGGIYDHLGGGFARYAVDEEWLVPHFEKMLYDNALLLGLLCEAWADTHNPLFRIRIEETIDWLTREMRQSGGGFASSLDADSEGEEGRYYVWSADEIARLLPEEDQAFFGAWYDVTPGGNWEGKTILNRLRSESMSDAETEARLERLRSILLEHRSTRVRPGLDDKILADWSGYLITALARAAELFENKDWASLAEKAFGFVTESMFRTDRPGHSWREGRLLFPGLASDFAALIEAALALYRLTAEDRFLQRAKALEGLMVTHHWDKHQGGYYLTSEDADDLVIRPRSPYDDATPNPNGVMVGNLVALWQLTGDASYRDRADAILTGFSSAIASNVYGAATLLNGFDARLNARQVVVVTEDGEEDQAGALLSVVRKAPSRATTLITVTSGAGGLSAQHPAHGKKALEGRPTAYVCKGESCSAPVTDAHALAALLAGP